MNCTIRILAVLITLAAGRLALADAADHAKTIAPFLTEQTLYVGHLDLERANLEAWRKKIATWVEQAKLDKELRNELDPGLGMGFMLAGNWMDSLKAAGAKHVYLIGDLSDLPMAPGHVIVPLEKDANAKVIASVLFSGRENGPTSLAPNVRGWPETAEEINGAVVLGSRATIEQLKEKKGKAAVRPEMAEALGAIGDAAVQIVAAPTADQRRALEAVMGKLPEELGGGDGATLIRNFNWAAAALDMPDKTPIRIRISMKDESSAKALHTVFEIGAANLAAEAKKEGVEGVDEILAQLTPRPEGAKLSLDVSGDDLTRLATRHLPPMLERARAHTKTVQSLNNVRQIVLACFMHAEENKGKWPDTLKAIDRKLLAPRLLNNPRHPDGTYIYLPPSVNGLKRDPGRLVVLHEEITAEEGNICVGFADGHCELMKIPVLKKRLAEQDQP